MQKNVVKFKGDKLLGQVVKQTGWKVKSDVTVNITYPVDGKNDKKLTFVMLIVYQVHNFY